MARVTDVKTLYFITGATPTAAEARAIAAIEGNVQVRSAVASAVYGSRLESTDFVGGAVPAAYAAISRAYPVVLPYARTWAVVGDSMSQNGKTSNASSAYLETNCVHGHAFSKIGGRAKLHPRNIFATGGYDTNDVLTTVQSAVTVTATNISFTAPNIISAAAAGLVNIGFQVGDALTISGAGAGANAGLDTGVIAAIDGNNLVMSGTNIVTQAAGGSVTVAATAGKTHWAAAMAAGTDGIIAHIGVNNATGRTLAQTKADFITMAEETLAAGKTLLVYSSTPRETFLGADIQELMGLVKWLLNPDGFRSGYSHVFVADTYRGVAGEGENLIRRNLDLDWLHLRPAGYDLASDDVATVLLTLSREGDAFKLFDEEPDGVINNNPGLTGTGGTLTSTVTGQIADNYRAVLQSTAGIAFVCSKFTDDNGLVWQQIDISGSPTDTSASKFMWVLADIPVANWPVNDEAEMAMLVEWFNCYNVCGITPEVAATGDATLKSRALDGYNAAENRIVYPSSRGVRTMVCPAVARCADSTPEASGLTAGLLISFSTQARTIDAAYRLSGYVTIRTTAAHGLLPGNKLTTTALTSDYCITNGEVAGVPVANTIITAVRASNIVTAGTPYRHNLLPGMLVTIAGLTADFNATDVRVLSVVDATRFTYTAAGADGTAADQAGTVTPSGTAGTQLTYLSPGTDGAAADQDGTLSPPVSGTVRFALPTARLVA